MSIKTVGYIRVSTKRQKNEGDSVPAQKERIKTYCKLNGLELIGYLEDAKSGKSIRSRPAMLELVDLCKKGEVQAFVCCRLDRMFRNVVDGITTADFFDKMGVDMHIMDMGDGVMGNIQTAMGRMIFINALNFAEFEGRRLGERVREVVKHKRANGEQHCAIAPYGYRFVRGKRVENPQEQAALKMIWQLKFVDGCGVSEIATRMTRSQYKTKTGKKRWNRSTLHNLLCNTMYNDLFAQFEKHHNQHASNNTSADDGKATVQQQGESHV